MGEISACVFDWSFEHESCQYKLPNLKPGNPPSVGKDCEVLSSSNKIIPPSPPRTEPSPWTCIGWFPEYSYMNINDPDGCSGCRSFPGYPDGWPPRPGDPRYGPSNTTWKATGEEKDGPEFRYAVEWTRSIRCKDRYGKWGRPRTQKTTIIQSAKWIIQNGISTSTGYTSIDCDDPPPPPPPPPPSYVSPDEPSPFR
jgi:hypothetical protein